MGETILFSWVGHSDLMNLKQKTEAASNSGKSEELGPIERVLRQYSCDLKPPSSGDDIETMYKSLGGSPINKAHLWADATPSIQRNFQSGNRSQPSNDVRKESIENPREKQKERIEGFRDWLADEFPDIEITLTFSESSNPTDYGNLYRFTDAQLREKCSHREDEEVTYLCHLNSGSPQMQSILLLLAKTRYPRMKLVKTSREMGLEWADFPFELENVRYLGPYDATGQANYSKQCTETARKAMRAFVGASPAMDKVKQRAYLMARSDGNIMIRGATGTGKGLMARLIHDLGSRKNGPFVEVNCGAYPPDLLESELFGHVKGAFTGAVAPKPGQIEQAHGGTLFLDEIGDMPLFMQVKLLKITEQGSTEREFYRIGGTGIIKTDVRIMAATNRNLEQMIGAGEFREDLYYRFGTLPLLLPSLKDLPDGDFSLLLEHAVNKANEANKKISAYRPKRFALEAEEMLRRYEWPGNFRQLQSVVSSLFLYEVPPDAEAVGAAVVEEVLFGLGKIAPPSGSDILSRPLDDGFSIDSLLSEVLAHYIGRAGRETGYSNMAEISRKLGWESGRLRGFLNRRETGQGERRKFQFVSTVLEELQKTGPGKKVLAMKSWQER